MQAFKKLAWVSGLALAPVGLFGCPQDQGAEMEPEAGQEQPMEEEMPSEQGAEQEPEGGEEAEEEAEEGGAAEPEEGEEGAEGEPESPEK